MPLTPRAAERIAREAAQNSFEKSAEALRRDWGVDWDKKQIQRWGERIGTALAAERDEQALAAQCGRRPDEPENPPKLLVFGPDGGRVQMREPDAKTGSRWREDKILAISSYLPGNGLDQDPLRLVTTYTATFGGLEQFKDLCQLEAWRRGLSQAEQVIALADCGTWIASVIEDVCPQAVRIADWYHAVEYLHSAAKAIHSSNHQAAQTLAESLKTELWDGKVKEILLRLAQAAEKLGECKESDPQDHPRHLLRRSITYFENNGKHMNYPYYRQKGWPIGSGVTESGVKLFNKRVKGTEQFWNKDGIESILALRALWLSQDQRWEYFWSKRPAYTTRSAA